MSVLIGIQNITKSFGSNPLFQDIAFTILHGDRIGLIGPNGAGKSTLLKILMGLEKADKGEISYQKGIQLSYASQSPEFNDVSLEQVLISETTPGSDVEQRARAHMLLDKAQFSDFTQSASKLSGGWKKRLDIVRTLMCKPDLVLLDEPTNHLDLDGILWLEKFLIREKLSYIVVSHDRVFLENVSTKVIELGSSYPQGVFQHAGRMEEFLERKAAFLAAQLQEEKGLASIVRHETAWLKRSPAARTTKSQARIQKAHTLKEELSELSERNKVQKVHLSFTSSERQTRKLLVAKNLSKTLGEKKLFAQLDITLSPGMRLGLLGQNGTGKTTLLKILAGMLTPDLGTLKYADDLKLVYFDQHREQIPLHLTLKEALSPSNDYVTYRGQMIHVHGWAKKFLFSTDRLSLPVSALSGGERARILIAKLMLQPADILFLDEPTNDLDMATLQVMEESLKEFTGAVILISHDRYWMERVCTQILALGAPIPKFFADYKQWEKAKDEQVKTISIKKNNPIESFKPAKIKLSYHEEKEYAEMEEKIVKIESHITQIQRKLEDPLIQTNSLESLKLYEELATFEKQLEECFSRWEYLEAKRSKSRNE